MSRQAVHRKDELKRLDDAEFFTIKPKQVLTQKLFQNEASTGCLEVRCQTLHCMIHFKKLLAVIPADADADAPPDMFFKLVAVCRSAELMNQTVLAEGLPTCVDDVAKFNRARPDVLQPVLDKWGAIVVAQKQKPFEESLGKEFYLNDNSDKLLPCAPTPDDLRNISSLQCNLGDSLMHVLASLRRDEALMVAFGGTSVPSGAAG